MSENCFVLGAGFSSDAGIPLQRDIIKEISDEDWLKTVEKLFSVNDKKDIENITLEDIFTIFDKAMINNDIISGLDYDDFYKTKNNILEQIIKLFNLSGFNSPPFRVIQLGV